MMGKSRKQQRKELKTVSQIDILYANNTIECDPSVFTDFYTANYRAHGGNLIFLPYYCLRSARAYSPDDSMALQKPPL
jgi:hypothetical protein